MYYRDNQLGIALWSYQRKNQIGIRSDRHEEVYIHIKRELMDIKKHIFLLIHLHRNH